MRICVLVIVIVVAATPQILSQGGRGFVSVGNGTFQLNNRPHYFIGTNYWYGSLLGLEKDKRRGINRLRKELDFLKKNGVTNLRLMAGAEGAGMINGVERVGPPLQPEQGKFDEQVLDGLDLILAEMAKRDMKAVIFFSNNWEWSGGFQQYVDWNGLVPDELNRRKLTWDELRDMVARFYVCFECKASYLKQVHLVMDRTNKITRRKYVDEPTIMAWELANEPRPMRPGANERYVEWIRRVAAEIKARDKNHLVTIGHEGSIGTEGMELFEEIHRNPNIDYLTIHIWPKNWGWLAEGFPVAVGKTVEYIEQHIAVARRLKKPLVIEEFGLPRDEKKLSPQRRGAAERPISKPETEHALAYRYTAFGLASQCLPLRLSDSAVSYLPQERHVLSLEPGSPTKLRDEYYRKIFSYLGNGVAGANFWAFGGTARPVKGQVFWKPGDEYMGDPPMEEQGLNTVFDIDRSTWNVIRSARRSIGSKN